LIQESGKRQDRTEFTEMWKQEGGETKLEKTIKSLKYRLIDSLLNIKNDKSDVSSTSSSTDNPTSSTNGNTLQTSGKHILNLIEKEIRSWEGVVGFS